MRGIIRTILTTGLILLGTALAQNSPSQESYKYDTSKQTVIKGTVAEVREYQCPVSGSIGIHLIMKQDTGAVEIHVAPAAFLKKYEIEIKKGDQVEIQGAKFTYEGKPAVMAKVIAADNVTYAFRDQNGKPLW